MIAFGCAITDERIFKDCARPGIELASEPDTQLIVKGSAGSVFRSYNLLLNLAAQREGLEALVILHQDAEIVDPDFTPKVRRALKDPDVALVGCAGALDVRSIAWWEGSVTWASFTHRYTESGGGELPALTWLPDAIPVFAETGEVDSIDGFVMAFSPWAIQNLRFDESIGGAIHGYDFDICMQARDAGKKVVTADLRVVHHHSLELIRDELGWIDAHIRLSEKWQQMLPQPRSDWEYRARRGEAELSAAFLKAGAESMLYESRIEELERSVEIVETSTSWRLTRPLRLLGVMARRLLGRSPRNADEHP